MRILVAGDFCPKYRVSECLNNGDYASIFDEIRKYTNNADFSILNFETNISDHTDRAIKKNGPSLCTTPNSIKAIKWAGFQVVTLANNHIYDYGQSGLDRTISLLDESEIKYVGAGKDLETACKTLYLKKDSETLALINACEHEFSIATKDHGGAYGIDTIKLYHDIQIAKSQSDYVVIILHGGHELYQLPSIRMQTLFRFLIEVGADAVINHHQHCFSGMEIYQGKPIYYGLGNFIFDYKKNSSSQMQHEGILIELELSKTKISAEEVFYVQCQDKVGITISQDQTESRARFEHLSRIIADSQLLKKENESYYRRSIRNILCAFQPYNNKYMSALFVKGFIPNFLRNKRIIKLLNLIECEAHNDKLKYVLKELVDTDSSI